MSTAPSQSTSIPSSTSTPSSASTPPSTSTSLSTPTSTSSLLPNYPILPQTHTYTLCPHTSPPANRPLNVQPFHDPLTNTSTLAGRCPECDQAFRRATESAILTAYLKQIKIVERQYGVFDEDFLDQQVAELYRQRDKEVARVWSGYSRRWGPGSSGRTGSGRMILRWERSERVEE